MNHAIKHAYDDGADTYRKRYDGIPARVEDVDLAFTYVSRSHPVVLEIGCAYGREATYITTKTNRYTGIDISKKYIDMARSEVLDGRFVCADVMDYEFRPGIDIVLAFASLLHNSKEDMAKLLLRLASNLNTGGVVFLSLKRREEYESVVEDDGVSKRRFYYYTKQTVLDLLPPTLDCVFYEEQSREEEWFTMILQKK